MEIKKKLYTYWSLKFWINLNVHHALRPFRLSIFQMKLRL